MSIGESSTMSYFDQPPADRGGEPPPCVVLAPDRGRMPTVPGRRRMMCHSRLPSGRMSSLRGFAVEGDVDVGRVETISGSMAPKTLRVPSPFRGGRARRRNGRARSDGALARSVIFIRCYWVSVFRSFLCPCCGVRRSRPVALGRFVRRRNIRRRRRTGRRAPPQV